MDENKKEYKKWEAPICYEVKMDCHSYDSGVCTLLESTSFKRGYCPFYKSRERAAAEKRKSEKRLIRLGYYKKRSRGKEIVIKGGEVKKW